MSNRKPRVCFAASSGGHLQELLMLRPLMDRYDSFLVTEKTAYKPAAAGIRYYYLLQVNRRERSCVPRLMINAVRSLRIYLKERPDVVICTGVLATIPLCLLCKLFGKKTGVYRILCQCEHADLDGKAPLPICGSLLYPMGGTPEILS